MRIFMKSGVFGGKTMSIVNQFMSNSVINYLNRYTILFKHSCDGNIAVISSSIKLNRRTDHSYITITAMFKKDSIPVEVVDHTIAHELVHYAHGFSSKNPRLHKYPHAGGVVQREMEERGVGFLNQAYKAWVKGYRKQLANGR